MSASPTPIEKYLKRTFTAKIRGNHSVTHDVYTRGEGAPIVLIQELPGIGPETLALADELIQKGFRVVMPHIFGPLGKTSMLNLIRVLCMRREIHLFATRQSSPVTDWLRALCRDVKEEFQAKGVGVIGMCLSGNFAIQLIADDSVLAAVASQPSLPGHSDKKIDLSPEEIEASKKRLDDVGPMLSYRFEKDTLCTANRFKLLDKAFNGDGKERIKLKTLPGKGHSVITIDFVDEEGHPTRIAMDEILAYFQEKLT